MKNVSGTIFQIHFGFLGSGKNEDPSEDEGKPAKAAVKNISPKEAKAMMDEGGVRTILDVRTEDEFRDGHIKGAILIPVDIIASRAETKLPDKNAVILVYCLSGGRSSRAAKTLAGMGYTNVYNFGGIMNWPYGTVTN